MEFVKKEGYFVLKEEVEVYFNNVKIIIDDVISGKIKGDIESVK